MDWVALNRRLTVNTHSHRRPMILDKSRHCLTIMLLVLACTGAGISRAQSHVTLEDYERAAQFHGSNLSQLYHLNQQVSWMADSSGFWFQNRSGKSIKWEGVSFEKLSRSPLFDQERLASGLSSRFDTTFAASSLPISGRTSARLIRPYMLDATMYLSRKEPSSP